MALIEFSCETLIQLQFLTMGMRNTSCPYRIKYDSVVKLHSVFFFQFSNSQNYAKVIKAYSKETCNMVIVIFSMNFSSIFLIFYHRSSIKFVESLTLNMNSSFCGPSILLDSKDTTL